MSKIVSMDLALIVSDKKVKGSGLTMGDLVMVVGTTMVPATRKDPYLQRELVRVVTCNQDGTPNLPKEGNDYAVYLIDPRSLEKVSDERDEEYKSAIKRQYGH